MALQTFVKVSGINNLSDARYCAGMGVNVLGFNVDPNNENRVSPENFKELSEWLSGVDYAAEIHHSILQKSAIKQLMNDYSIQYIEVSDAQNINLLAAEDFGLHIIYKIDISQESESSLHEKLVQNKEKVTYFLLDSNDSNGYDKKLLDFCLPFAADFPLILACCITENNVHRIIDSGVKGIGLKGGDEIRPGYKNFDELADILEAIEVD